MYNFVYHSSTKYYTRYQNYAPAENSYTDMSVLCQRLSLKQGTGNRGMGMGTGNRGMGTGNGNLRGMTGESSWNLRGMTGESAGNDRGICGE